MLYHYDASFKIASFHETGIASILKNKLGSIMPTAEFEIRIACDMRGLSNNPFSADHREIATKSSLSAEIISFKSFLSPDKYIFKSSAYNK
jgi:hypothetical protein